MDRSTLTKFSRPDLQLALQEWGAANVAQPSLIFTHGFGQNRLNWTPCAQALAENGWHCISFDGRGHGDSDWCSNGNYQLDDFSEDLLAVRNSVAAPSILIGASMGGLLALLVQAQANCFAGIALIDVTPTWEKQGVARIFNFMTAYPDGFSSLQAAADAVSEYLPHREQKDPQRLAQHLRLASNGRYRWHWDPRLLEHIPKAAERYQPQLIEAARAVKCPVHLLAGTRSDVISKQTIQAFQQLVPHATTQDIADATHMVVGDQHEVFLHELEKFLQPFRFSDPVSH